MKCTITGRKYSEEARYAEWDTKKEFPCYDKVAEQVWEIEASSLDEATEWLAKNHPDMFMGCNISCENGDFAAYAVPSAGYFWGKGNFETQSARTECVKKMYAPKKVWTEAQIADLIQTNDTVLYRALKKLYNEQTDAEQDMGETKERNGRGFNGIDSKFLSSVSEFLIKHGFLTSKQKSVTRRMLKKYNKQLTRLANA